MKTIGICSDGQDLKSKVRYGLGLSPYVCVVDWDNNNLTNPRFVDTSDMVNLMQNLVSEGIEALVTANIGPWAYNSLASQGIGVYESQGLEISDAASEYFAGNLPQITTPNTGQGRGTGRGQGLGRGGQGMGKRQGRGQGRGREQGRGRNRP